MTQEEAPGLAAVATSELKPSDLLKDVSVTPAEQLKVQTKLYRCSVDERFGKLQIMIAGIVFATETFGWRNLEKGDEAEQVKRRGSVTRLTDGQIELLKRVLPFHYLRPVTMKDNRYVSGYQHVDACDADPKNPKLIPGRLDGTEIPLRDVISLEEIRGTGSVALPWDSAKKLADMKKENELLEKEDEDEILAEVSGQKKSKRGPKGGGKESTVTTTAQTGTAGVIG